MLHRREGDACGRWGGESAPMIALRRINGAVSDTRACGQRVTGST